MEPKGAKKALIEFFESGPKRGFARKEVITSQFVNSDKMYWVNRGYVKVVSYSQRGDARIHHIYGPQEMFPLTRLDYAQNKKVCFYKTMNFLAISETELFEKSAAEFEAFIKTYPEVLNCLVAQQYYIFDRLYNLTMESALQRVAYRLLSLALRFGKEQDGHTVVDLPITIQEIADTIDVSRETTGRVLNELETKGFVMLSRKSILLYQQPLRELVGVAD